MTQFLTTQVAIATGDLVLMPVFETTAAQINITTSATTDDGYNDKAVRRILKAKAARPVRAPSSPDELLSWLNK